MILQLQEAQDRYKAFSNEFRKENLQFQVGNKVWLLWCNIKTTWPCDKLDSWRIEPYKKSNIPDKTQPLPPCIEIDSHKEYEVEEVLDFSKDMADWNILFIGVAMKNTSAHGSHQQI